jgi:hypothetical protein
VLPYSTLSKLLSYHVILGASLQAREISRRRLRATIFDHDLHASRMQGSDIAASSDVLGSCDPRQTLTDGASGHLDAAPQISASVPS